MSGEPPKWPIVSIGDVCQFKYGKALKAEDRQPGMYAVYGSNGRVGSHISAITTGPTIVIGRKGSFGEVHYTDLPCWPIDTTYYIDSSSTKADLKWLAYRLRAAGLTGLNRAAAVPGLSREDAYRLTLALPPLSEQRRIVRILDWADALRVKRYGALTRLDELAQSIFLDMFGRNENLSTVKLGDLLSFVTSGGRGWAQYYAPTGSRFVRSLDVQMNEISTSDAVYVRAPNNVEARRTRVSAGDVLLTITGSLIGRVTAVPADLDGSYISQHVAILRPHPGRVFAEFLSFYLSLPYGGQKQIANKQYGQTKPGLNFEQIRDFTIPDVPLEAQCEFLRVLVKVRGLKLMHGRQLACIEDLLGSLQYRGFRGGL